MAIPVASYRITDHAALEMRRRGISEETVRHVLTKPEQRFSVRSGRDVLQSQVRFGDRLYLVRIFVDLAWRLDEVVTVYRTSNIARYWRDEP